MGCSGKPLSIREVTGRSGSTHAVAKDNVPSSNQGLTIFNKYPYSLGDVLDKNCWKMWNED